MMKLTDKEKTIYTPGPWEYWETDIYCQIMAPKSTAYRIADVHSYAPSTNGPNREQRNANAQLIAAAPEMLEAIKMALSYLNVCHMANSAGAMIKVAQAQDVLNRAIGNIK